MNNTLQVLESIRNLEMKINRKYTNDFLKKVPKKLYYKTLFMNSRTKTIHNIKLSIIMN